MSIRKNKVKNFWWFNNTTCWKIQRESMVDFYLYLPTMRYVYKTFSGEWQGTKDPTPAFLLSDAQREKIKKFNSEDDAVRWLAGEKI